MFSLIWNTLKGGGSNPTLAVNNRPGPEDHSRHVQEIEQPNSLLAKKTHELRAANIKINLLKNKIKKFKTETSKSSMINRKLLDRIDRDIVSL